MPVIRLLPILLLGLAGCQQAPSGDAPGNAAAPTAAAGEYLNQMAALPPAQQQMVLFRAVRDAGQDCQDINRTERLPDQGGKAVWRVTCRGGGQLAVSMSTDGVATVVAPRK